MFISGLAGPSSIVVAATVYTYVNEGIRDDSVMLVWLVVFVILSRVSVSNKVTV